MNKNRLKNQKMMKNMQNSCSSLRTLIRYRNTFLALIMLFFAVTAAFAGIRPAYAEGSGTADDPWPVSTWSELYDKLQSGGWIKLTANVTYGKGGGDHAEDILEVGAEVILDLNGHIIDRGLKNAEAAENGYVIKVGNGKNLTLMDTAGGGIVTGGNNSDAGGGVYVSNGTFTMQSGTISDNTAQYGGGVYVYEDGTFSMIDGTISDNTVQNNGGGVYSGGTFNISGNPVITENKKGDSDNNVWLPNGKNVTVTASLTNTTPIGVTLESGTGTFTSGLSGKGVTVNFRSDAGYAVGIEQNEACLNNETADRTIYFCNEGSFLIDSLTGSLNTVFTLYPNTYPFPDTFRGWNTLPDGTGAHYKDGGKIILTGDVTLYAQLGNAAEIVGFAEYPTLQDAIDAAEENDTVTLLTHIDSLVLAGDWPLVIGDDRKITLNLNGYTIDRGLTEGTNQGYVIEVSGELTLRDSSTAKTGTITGGFGADGEGGGVYIDSGGTFTMYGGTISGNRADFGGGVYISASSQFTIYGGMIRGNTADSNGGGVYVGSDGGMIVGGKPYISGNVLSGGTANNVFLGLESKINISSALSNTNPIGITMQTNDVFTFGLSDKGTAANFVSDDDWYAIRLTNDGEAELYFTGNIITVTPSDHWTVTVSPKQAYENTTVTLTVTPSSSSVYILKPGGLKVSYTDGIGEHTVTVTAGPGVDPMTGAGEWTFTMPAADVTVSGEFFTPAGWLQYQLDNAESRSTVTLDRDINWMGEDSGPLTYDRSGVELTLDLNGHTINRGLTEAAEAVSAGNVITVSGGTLTLTDSSASEDNPGTGTITGGKSILCGGVYVNGGGRFLMESGTISGNIADLGGGVCVDNSSSVFNMNGGTISSNIANDSSGGGVSVTGMSTFIMTGGTISGNSAENGGGVSVCNTASTFRMSGGTISNNMAAEDGGGVAATGIFEMTGGTIFGNVAANNGGGVYYWGSYPYTYFRLFGGKISGNKAGNNGGGVVATGNFDISNNPMVSNNLAGGVISDGVFTGGDPNNIYLFSDEEITILGQLTGEDASIGVTLETGSGTFAYVYGYPLADNDFLKFFSDDPAYITGKNADGQLYLGIPVYISGISATDKIYDGTTDASLTGTAVLKSVRDDTQVPGLTVSEITAAFADKNVRNGKNVTVTGVLLSDPGYAPDLDKTNGTLGLTAAITPKPVMISGVTAVSRAYEAGNLNVELTGGEVSGKVESDQVSVNLSAASSRMADADIGTDKPVTVTGVKLGGADAVNYSVSGQMSGLTVTISADGTIPSGNAALTLPSGLMEIRTSAFEGSSSFDEVYLPDGMQTIGSRAFADCGGLKLIHIPGSVTSIADDAFAGSIHVIFSCTSDSDCADYARDHYIMRQNP